MDTVDASEHYTRDSEDSLPSFLTIILDTNPLAWAYLSSTLPLQNAIAALLVFINAHIAFNQANSVAVIASHVDRAEFLYPPAQPSASGKSSSTTRDANGDVEMSDAPAINGYADTGTAASDDANFYRPFATIASSLHASLRTLLKNTAPTALSNTSTALAGALTLALTNANKLTVQLTPSLPTAPTITTTTATLNPTPSLHSRVLILSASPAPAAQYIPLMNTIFAAARLSIPIDVLALTPTSSPFLQQAATTTSGSYITLAEPQGLLQTLLQAFLPGPPSRGYLVPATQTSVDFRAACFCHRKVVDVGFVCSICLSIFCEPPPDAVCLTCDTKLKLGDYGRKPVVGAKKKKRKRREGEVSGTATPAGRETPGL